MYTHTHAHIYTHIQSHIHTPTHPHAHIHTHTHTHTLTHPYTHTHTHTHTHSLTHPYTHTHTHPHTLFSVGSLEQINSKTPPRSLKIRTFSIAEQQEQEAASGTRDKRVSRSCNGGFHFLMDDLHVHLL